MPYIKIGDRKKYEQYIQKVVAEIQVGIDIELEGIVEFAKSVTTAGEANYVISSIIWRLFDAKPSYTYGNQLISIVEDTQICLAHKNAWTDQFNEPLYMFLKTLCYSIRYNVKAVRGMLACVEFEFYRRRMAPYEILKAQENGDIL